MATRISDRIYNMLRVKKNKVTENLKIRDHRQHAVNAEGFIGGVFERVKRRPVTPNHVLWSVGRGLLSPPGCVCTYRERHGTTNAVTSVRRREI